MLWQEIRRSPWTIPRQFPGGIRATPRAESVRDSADGIRPPNRNAIQRTEFVRDSTDGIQPWIYAPTPPTSKAFLTVRRTVPSVERRPFSVRETQIAVPPHGLSRRPAQIGVVDKGHPTERRACAWAVDQRRRRRPRNGKPFGGARARASHWGHCVSIFFSKAAANTRAEKFPCAPVARFLPPVTYALLAAGACWLHFLTRTIAPAPVKVQVRSKNSAVRRR